MKAKAASRLVVLCGTVALLSGCASGPSEKDKAETEALKTRIAQLEQENETLRAKAQGQEAVKSFLTTVAQSVERDRPVPTSPLSQSSQAASEASSASSSSHPKFDDLTETAQRPMIEELATVGVFDGMPNAFDPDRKITRGEYVTWLYKSYNSLVSLDKQMHLAPSAPPYFKDLKADHPAYKYAQALANAGYSVGYDDKTFRADQPITREEMVGMKVGVDCGKSFDPYRGQMAFVWKFSDSKDIDERFTGYIHQDFYVSGPYGSNIQRAFGKVGTFHPKTAVTRAEAAGTLWQIGQFGMNGQTAAAALKKTS